MKGEWKTDLGCLGSVVLNALMFQIWFKRSDTVEFP